MIAKAHHHRLGHLRFRDLELVRTLATTGSLRRAAAVLQISQPVLSRRLGEIEHIVGVVLWDRSRRGLSATLAGGRFLTWAETLLKELEQAHADVRASEAPPVRLGAPPDFMLSMLPHVLLALSPQRAMVTEGPVPQLLARLEGGELDAVVANHAPGSSVGDTLAVEPLYRQRLIVVAPLALSIANSWAALSEVPWILPPVPDGPVRRALDARFIAAGVRPPSPTFEVAQLLVTLRLVAHGLGVSAVPDNIVPEAEMAGQVRQIAVKPAIEFPPACLLYRRAMADHPRTRAIAAAVRAAVNEMKPGSNTKVRQSLRGDRA